MNFRRGVVLLVLLLGVTGCALKRPTEQRTTEGLTAEEIFTYRIIQQNGREPNFEERRTWRDDIDQRIAAYLRDHLETANSFDVTKFRFLRQASAGMNKEQILILLGPPDGATTDAAGIEKIARKYWPQIKGRATEAWIYPLGWNLYFGDGRLVDVTQYLP